MSELTYEQLLAACRQGGSSVLTSITPLAPAGGSHASVAPAKFVEGNNSVFAYETRFVNGEAVTTVLIDSKQSQLNRGELAVHLAINDGHPLLGRVPLVSVTYGTGENEFTFTDLQLPHRAWDGHIRAGSVDGQPATDHPTYRAARNANPANAKALLEFSPGSIVFGSWDSSRKSNQARYRSVLVGEIIGVLADQSGRASDSPRRGGARVDPVSMGFDLKPAQIKELAEAQRAELSPKLVSKAKAPSELGLGGIPPVLDNLGGVSCRQIIRQHVLSFAALRQLRFGLGADGDAAARALLAAYALSALARSDAELCLRANCDLVEMERPTVTLDQRYGEQLILDPISIELADQLLERALEQAEKVGVSWQGQRFQVVGNPVVLAAASSSEE